MDTRKAVHSIVLDAGPLLNNDPSMSSLLAKSEKLFTVPSVLAEVRDQCARARVETTVLPFLVIRAPSIASIKFITEFARKTGDLAVLSKPDTQLIALAYELECERNHGDWRLRRVPGQKGLNGVAPLKQENVTHQSKTAEEPPHQENGNTSTALQDPDTTFALTAPEFHHGDITNQENLEEHLDTPAQMDALSLEVADGQLAVMAPAAIKVTDSPEIIDHTLDGPITSDAESADSDGWITPSNLKNQPAKDQSAFAKRSSETTLMQVATITTDFAVQNVLLQMNLNLLSPSMQRVRHLKTYILRCHACFEKTRDMTKQFCPRCGKPTLNRVACSTSANGDFKVHLKKNMQWNTRGDRFSIPKPVPGAAHGKVGIGKGGGKGGWGQELILVEDQKEYLRAMKGQSKRKERSLMDEDFLPGILTGERGGVGGQPKIGGGRNVNSKKR
ncbi:Nin1 binding protein [Lignoscripta atroalba]|nr:Nin1 binding protein [Lignoscripta atroalba]